MVLLGFFLRITTFILTLTQIVDGFQSRMLLNNGLALTPQMGWNSWNHFRCDINETLIKQTDEHGIQGKKIKKEGDLEVWAGPLSEKLVAVILWNRGSFPANITARWVEIGLESLAIVDARDLWEHSILSSVKTQLSALVEPRACKMYTLTRRNETAHLLSVRSIFYRLGFCFFSYLLLLGL